MVGSLKAELRKLRHRPGAWALGAVGLLLTLFFGYVLQYLLLRNSSSSAPSGFGSPEEILAGMLPEGFVGTALGAIAGFGGLLILIVAAQAAGGEYGWGTVKTVLTQRPPRLGVFAGQVSALALVADLFVLLVFGASAAASYAVAQAEDASVAWPAFSEIARGFGAGWLISATWATLGLALAVLFRQTAPAIGLGLVYLLLLEGLVLTIAGSSGLVSDVRGFLPAANANALAGSFGGQIFGPPGSVTGPTIDPGQAALVLTAYAVGLILLAGFLYRRRDVL